MKICLDTNIFIAVMNKEANSLFCEMIFNAIEKNILEPIVSTIVVAEILVGFNQNGDTQGKHKFLNKLKVKYHIVPVTLELAELSAEIRASTKIKLPNALVYASAIQTDTEVLISNDNFFISPQKIPILTPKEFIDTYSELIKK